MEVLNKGKFNILIVLTPDLITNIGLIIIGIGVFIFIIGASFIDQALFGHDLPLAKFTGMLLIFLGSIIALFGLGQSMIAIIITLLLLVFIWIFSYMLKGEHESYINFIGKQATITTPSINGKIGEIKVVGNDGKTYTFIAQPNFQSRNMKFEKGDQVYITGFNAIIAEYGRTPPETLEDHRLQEIRASKNNTVGQCVVCFLPITTDSEYTITPCCHSYAHTSHLLEWVKIKGACPNCQQRLYYNNNTVTLKAEV